MYYLLAVLCTYKHVNIFVIKRKKQTYLTDITSITNRKYIDFPSFKCGQHNFKRYTHKILRIVAGSRSQFVYLNVSFI